MGSLPVSAEVLVIGAGPVGLFAALRLGKAGIRVTVLEKESSLSQLPRACMFYPQPQFALADAGIWEAIIKGGGFRSTGLDIRLPPTPDGNDRKAPGQIVGSFPKDPNHDPLGTPVRPPAISMLNMAQPELTRVLMQSALETGYVQVVFNKELVAILDDGSTGSNVVVSVKDVQTGLLEDQTASFLVGSDGGRSRTRSLLGISFPGHTWPEKLIATDVWLKNTEDSPTTTTLLMEPIHYTIITPLTPPVIGEVTKWRLTFAVDPKELTEKTEQELLSEEYISFHYDRAWAGPRPLAYNIERAATYTIHQRLASKLRHGRCLLAGDAAHVNNVIGGLGLSNCLMEAVALSDALILVLKEGKPVDPVLTMYSDERRQVFQFFIDPVSSWSKLRIQAGEHDDWFFRCLKDPSSPAFGRWIDMMENFWPTRIKDMAKAM
ncbi:FAD binding domain protein [Colletotrichum asianum]|uniref:FAD binding domain-containing protein n=1 Tax=Colletotrichum asianum TaxID=702518 RepID=A0A8H3ZM07_9PEZI|nr:FAD binding domain-containing protein [Colletotrichum asianum]